MKLQNIYLFIIILTLASCSAEPYWPGTDMENGRRYSTFDFCSTFECDVDFSLGKREFVYVYTQDPSENPDAEAIRTLLTDEKGRYECKLVLPTALIGKRLYASVSSGVISATVTKKGASFIGASRAVSRENTVHGDLHPSISLCLDIRQAYCAKLNRYNTNNLDKIGETGDIAIKTKEDNTQVLFTFLHSFGWNSNFMYYYYYKDVDPINSENKERYIEKICNDKDGRFLCTRGWGVKINSHRKDYENNPEHDNVTILTSKGVGGINLRFSDIQGADKTLAGGDVEKKDGVATWTPTEYTEVLKNSTKVVESMIGLSNHLYFYGDIDLESNEYLYSMDDEKPFPKGYKIGFILKSVKHTLRDDLSDLSKADPKLINYYFSNYSLNEPDKVNGNQKHAGRFWSSEEVNNFSRFVYGFEDSYRTGKNDGTDCNFTDFLYMVSTDPMADTEEVASLTSTYSAVTGTMLFEDLFPEQGDYDMNDVIVEYRKVKEYEKDEDTGNDYIKNFYIEITPVHNGATYDDYLYVGWNPENKWGLMKEVALVDFQSEFGANLKSVSAYNKQKLQSGNVQDLKTIKLYILKDYVPYKQPGRKLTLTDAQVSFNDIEVFLYVANTNREVHVTKKKCMGVNGSSNADLDESMNEYRAPQNVEGYFLPWAMDIPIKSDARGNGGFIPVTESVMITDEYLKFFDWYNKVTTDPWYENQYYNPWRR